MKTKFTLKDVIVACSVICLFTAVYIFIFGIFAPLLISSANTLVVLIGVFMVLSFVIGTVPFIYAIYSMLIDKFNNR